MLSIVGIPRFRVANVAVVGPSVEGPILKDGARERCSAVEGFAVGRVRITQLIRGNLPKTVSAGMFKGSSL